MRAFRWDRGRGGGRGGTGIDALVVAVAALRGGCGGVRRPSGMLRFLNRGGAVAVVLVQGVPRGDMRVDLYGVFMARGRRRNGLSQIPGVARDRPKELVTRTARSRIVPWRSSWWMHPGSDFSVASSRRYKGLARWLYLRNVLESGGSYLTPICTGTVMFPWCIPTVIGWCG